MFNYNIFAGSENGLFKGINTAANSFLNLNKIETLNKNKEIVSLCWKNDENQDEIFYATKDNQVNLYKCGGDTTEDQGVFDFGEGTLKGFQSLDDKLVSCLDTGVVNLWDLQDKKSLKTFNVGASVYCVKKCPFNQNLFATGGKENDLKVWDLAKDGSENIFKAKNLPDNWMQLREAVWVMCIDFFAENKVVVGTGHHQIRIYDIKSGIRKPVFNMSYGEHPITALAVRPNVENQLIAGNTHGEMELIDVRNGKAIKKYKNFSGTIKSIAINAENDSVASCGLDRFVRVHDINDSKLLNRIYVKSRLNCLLFSKHEPIKPKEAKKAEQSIEDRIEDDLVSDINSEDLGTDQLWSDLESVENEHPAVFAKKRAAKKSENKEDVFKMPKKLKSK